ncbi:hypothetical protein WN943_024173 [Citrus x changshan-huyou]
MIFHVTTAPDEGGFRKTEKIQHQLNILSTKNLPPKRLQSRDPIASCKASERVKLSNGSFSCGCGGLRMVATRSMKERGTRRTKEQLPSEGSAIRL